MAQKKGIRIHQYLDYRLVRAKSNHTCLQHTQTLVVLCQELGVLVNMEKSELEPRYDFNDCKVILKIKEIWNKKIRNVVYTSVYFCFLNHTKPEKLWINFLLW